MRKLLRALTTVFVLALLFLWIVSYYERGSGDSTASGILQEIKMAGIQIGESFNRFLDETGIRQGAADILERGADMLRDVPAQKQPPDHTPDISREWV